MGDVFSQMMLYPNGQLGYCEVISKGGSLIMRLPWGETETPKARSENRLPISRERVMRWVALTAVVALAAGLRFANLESLGYSNHYYTAAVTSMLKSWHNFFFVAAEPGGAVSVDKPPVGLWLQAMAAYFLGVNGFSVLLPQLLAGVLSVVVLYHLVQRSFGAVAGLLAALALAITPIAVATDRNNTMDSTLVLALLLAAWAFIRATETGKLRYLLLGAGLVGLGFNIKMLEAYLALPAFYALYFLGSTERLWRKAGRLALASVLLLVVSFSWAVAVDLTPAEQRPYVGSSGDNSELSLIVGYNGMNRLLGMVNGRSNQTASARPVDSQGAGTAQAGNLPPVRPGGNNGGAPAGQLGGSAGRGSQAGGAGNTRSQPAGGGTPGGTRGAASSTGDPGPWRLFIPPLSKELSWLLPLGLAGALLLLLSARLSWPLAPYHQALVLWGGWLVTGGVFFSVAEYYHEYYLIILGAPLAALVGIGVVQAWRLRERRPWLALGLLLAGAGCTLWLQVTTAQAYLSTVAWLPWVLASAAAGAGLLVAATVSQRLSRGALAGLAWLVAALLVTPGIWAGLTNLNASANSSLPSAYGGKSSGSANRYVQVNQALLDYLEPRTQNTFYLMAVPSSMQGADYVLATGRPVLYLGGFKGADQVVTANQLAQLVETGRLRYIYWSGNGGLSNQTDLSAWITTACTAVQGFEATTSNVGTPDGTTAEPERATGGGASGPGRTQVSLYDCGG